MDNSKSDQGENPFSSLSQIKVRQGTSDGPARVKESSVADTKQNKILTPTYRDRKSSDAAVIETGSPIASVRDAVSKFGGSPSVRDAVSKFGGATSWKANRSPSMERRKSFQEPKKVPEERPVPKKQLETTEESKTPKFTERRKSFQEHEKVQEETHVLKKETETPVLKKQQETVEGPKNQKFVERLKSFQEPAKVQEEKPVLKKQPETSEEPKNKKLIEKLKGFQEPEKVQDEKPVLMKQSETTEESKNQKFTERRKSFQDPEKMHEAPLPGKQPETAEETKTPKFIERRKSFQEPEKVLEEEKPVPRKPSETADEPKNRIFMERRKSFQESEKVPEEKSILKKQSETIGDPKRRILKERQKSLERVHEDIPVLKKQCERAEEAKNLIVKDLNRITKLIEHHKLNLEKAQKEEHQAKQDSEVAKRRVEEMENEIANEAGVGAKAQLEVIKGRTLAAASDLQTLKDELNTLRKNYASLMNDKDTAAKKDEKTVSAIKEVENLTIELMKTKASLESARAAKSEAEKHRTAAAKAREQDILNLEKELKQAEEELQKLNRKCSSTKDYRSKLDTSTALLHELKAELAAYMETKQKSEALENPNENLEEQDKNADYGVLAAIATAKKKLKKVKQNTDKAKNELSLLKEAAAPLKSQLESEKLAQETIRQREEMLSVTVASAESELKRTMAEISPLQAKQREARAEMVKIAKKLQKASEEADKAKSYAKVAREELQKEIEEADQAKSRASTIEGKLVAANKEIEAAKAAENLALAAINALQETETAQTPNNKDSPNVITLSLDEYYKLNKQAHEAEVEADLRVTESLSHAEAAKQSNSRSLIKLEEISSELASKKEALEIARQQAEKANGRKLGLEQELTEWRVNHKQQLSSKSDKQNKTFGNAKESKDIHAGRSLKTSELSNGDTDSSSKGKKKKKRSMIPRFFMFLSKKKSHSKGN